jgi:uncharacterized membrane protein
MSRGTVASPARRVAVAGVVGALYVVLSLLVAPFAFGPLQFRIGEALKPIVIRHPQAIPAFGVGTFVVNLFSPFGVLDFALMPFVDMAGGVLCWAIARRVRGAFGTYLASAVYAVFTSVGVAFVLAVAGGLPFLASLVYVAASEVVLLLIGNAIFSGRAADGLLGRR